MKQIANLLGYLKVSFLFDNINQRYFLAAEGSPDPNQQQLISALANRYCDVINYNQQV